jgi:amidase
MSPVHAFCDDALSDLDGVGLVDALKARQVSVREVVEAAIARTEAVNPVLNGLAYEAFDRARARSDAAPICKGFFSGVPTFIKDNGAVAGMPTMRGTDAWEPRPARVNGDFVSSYLATGTVPLGLTRMSEFGFNAAAEHPRLGAVHNPWDLEYTAGGSSSGSGAFVAAGVVPIAHANDGGGSIRIPASCNGLVGLKPSRGRLPLDKELRLLPVSIVENGVLTRSVRDTAAFYREAERLQRNPKLPGIGDVTGPGRTRLRIAVCTRLVTRESSPEIRELTLKIAALLEELGHHVCQLDEPPLPSYFADDFLLYWALLATALVRADRHVVGAAVDRGKLDNLTLGLVRHGSRNLHRMPLAIARLANIRRATARLYRTCDVLLTPTVAHRTPRIGHLDPTANYQQIIDRLGEWVAFTPPHNVTGEPAISLPLAETAAGLPQGMMFAAALGQDARLLELAYELEQAQPWRRIQFG